MKFNKIFVFLFLGMFLISFASAAEFDNIKAEKDTTFDGKSVEGNELLTKYKPIEITNIFGLGSTLFEGYLSSHDYSCGQDCESIFEVKLHSDSPIIDSVEFLTEQEDGSWIEQDVRSYQFYISTEGQKIDVEDWETQCVDLEPIYSEVNGTYHTPQECSNVLIGTHKEDAPIWTPYTEGTVMPKNTYKVKLEAEKKPSRTVDWVITTQGKKIEEWAVWGMALPDIHYKFNNNLNQDGSGSVTETTKGTIQYEAGVINQAYEPDASNNFKIDDTTLTDFGTGDFSVAYWFQISSNANRKMFYGTVTNYYSTGGNIRVNDGSGVILDYANASHYDNTYHHFVWKREGTNNTLWIDGVLRDTAVSAQSITNGAIEIGQYAGGLEPIQGMDDLRIYKGSALSDTEIQAIYNSGTGSEDNGGTVTLNSPADDGISPTPEVTFNATATVTGGATLVNMSLWTNATGTWALGNTTNLTGTPLEINYQASYPSSGASTGKVGLTFTPKENIKINNLTKYVSTNANTAYIQTAYASGILDSASFVGNTATFTGDVELTAGTKYWLLMDNGGASYTVYYNGATGSYPLDETDLWINNSVDESGSEGTIYYSIVSFNTQEIPKSSTQTWNKTITDTTIWNVEACDSDGDCGFATSNYSVSLDATAPTFSVESPTGLLDYGYVNGSEEVNVTFTDSNLDSCWYDYNGTNTTIEGCLTGVKNSTSITLEQGNYNITFYANDSVGNLNSTSTNWSYKVFQNSFIFDNETRAGDQEDFSLNLTLGTGIGLTSASFMYGGEAESPAIYSDGQERIINVTDYSIPSYLEDTNVSIYFHLVLSDATEINTTNATQLAAAIFLDNCSTYTNNLFNISLFDEETKTTLDGDIEFNYQILNVPAYDVISSINLSFTGVNTTNICSQVNLTGENFVQSVEIRYLSDGYEPELYHVQRAAFVEGGTPINLYDLNSTDSTEFKITYQDSTFSFVDGAIVQLQRKYISENAYEVVEAPLTSSDGTTVVHVDLDSIKYKATVVKNGVVLDTFDNLVFDCASELTGECEQKLLGTIDPQNTIDYDTSRDFTYSVARDENTVTLSFSIPSGQASSVNIQLAQKDQFGNSTLCNQTVVSSAGSIECTFDDTIGESYLDLTIYKADSPIAATTYIIPEANSVDFLGNNYILVIIIMLSLVGMAVTSPEWMIVNAIMTMLLAGTLWLINGVNFVMGLGMLMWLVIAAAILILKLAKQEDR